MRFDVKTETEFTDKIKEASDRLILAYFWAEWCRPCKLLGPKLKDVELQYPELIVLKIEVDEAEDLSALFKINMLPTFYFLKSNFILTDFSGSNMDKLKENVKKYYRADVSTLKDKVKPLASIYESAQNKEKKSKKKSKEITQVPLPELINLTAAETKVSNPGPSKVISSNQSENSKKKKEKEGFRNDFQEAMERVDKAYLDEILKSQTQEDGNSNERQPQEKQITYEEIQQMSAKLGKGDVNYDMDLIVHFLQMALATFTQTQLYLKPLLNKLKSRTLPEDILDSLKEIVRHLLDRNYIMASDAYLQMAIGNAPWPIGVTMVGIHARTGREKIFSKNVAHVLNDETQRKYIQGLKRLMTKCQQYFPTDPSRCVEYCPTSS